MTFTPENVADMLTSGDNDYSESWDCWKSLSAHEGVLSVKLTPVDDETGDKGPAEHFEAHVFAVEPAPPVAAKPISLDVEFVLELVDCEPGRDYYGWTVVAKEWVENRAWTSRHRLVIRHPDGHHYEAGYDVGLTPNSDIGPFEDVVDVVRFTPVERRTRVVQAVEWVTPAAPFGSPSDLDAPEATDGR